MTHTRRWPASLSVVAVLALQLAVPAEVAPGPRWLLPACEAALLLPLVWTSPRHLRRDSPSLRRLALGLVGTLVTANAGYLARLVGYLTTTGSGTGGRVLVHAALLVWVHQRGRVRGVVLGDRPAADRSPAHPSTPDPPRERTCSSRR